MSMTREKFNMLCALVDMAGIAKEAKMRPEEFVTGLCGLSRELESKERGGAAPGSTGYQSRQSRLF